MDTPKHYACCGIQPLTFIMINHLGFCEGNIIKYICRYPHKDGVNDLHKARHYLDTLIAQREKEMTPRDTTH